MEAKGRSLTQDSAQISAIVEIVRKINSQEFNFQFWILLQQILIFLSFEKIKNRENLMRQFVDIGFKFIKIDDQAELEILKNLASLCAIFKDVGNDDRIIAHEILKKIRNKILSRQGGVFSYIFNKSELEIPEIYVESDIFESRWEGVIIKEPKILKSPSFEIGKEVTAEQILQIVSKHYQKVRGVFKGKTEQSVFFIQGDDYYDFSVEILSGKKNNVAVVSETKY